MKFWVEPLRELNSRDTLWLRKLANGHKVCDLHPASDYTKQRLSRVRDFFGARTTTQAVVEAMRRGIIPLHPESQCIPKSDRATIATVDHVIN